MNATRKRNLRNGLLFTLPWIVGFAVFVVYPVGASLVYSVCDYSVLRPPRFIGLANYRELLSDRVFHIALQNTLTFAAISIGLTLVASLGLALLLATERRGARLYRTVFFMPVLIPQVAVASILLWVFHSEHGVVNLAWRGAADALYWLPRDALGLNVAPPEPPTWISQQWAMTTLIIASLWSIGNAMIIYIAGLQGVPKQLYEAADLDGAGPLTKAWYISLPMIGPLILFNLIMGIIGAFNMFALPYFMTSGNQSYNLGHSITFYAPLINQTAIEDLRMGYASAMAWVLFAIVFTLTLIVMRFAMGRVYYGGGER